MAYHHPERVADLFWSKVDKTPSCWLWRGCTVNGYGRVRIAGVGYVAHRAAWQLAGRGDVPDGLFVCHTCDVRNCVNPDHLFLGTKADNSRDMVRKGRSARAERLPQTRL